MKADWRILSDLAQEADTVDPIDWGELNISEKEAFHLMAMHVAEMENDHLTNQSIIVKLLVENMVLNLKLLGKK